MESIIEIVSKKSKIRGGKGTIIITRIHNKNATTVKSLLRKMV